MHCHLDRFAHSVGCVDVDPAVSLGFSFDLSGLADGRDLLVRADVAQLLRVGRRHQLLRFVALDDLRLDLIGLPRVQLHLRLLHLDALGNGVIVRPVRRVQVERGAGADVYLLPILHDPAFNVGLVRRLRLQPGLRPGEGLVALDGLGQFALPVSSADGEEDVIAPLPAEPSLPY